jgi:ADP-ribose pyrophosphatase YjhB (NUDIX family)/adenosine deaminase
MTRPVPIAPGHRAHLHGDAVVVHADDDHSRLRRALSRHLVVRGDALWLGEQRIPVGRDDDSPGAALALTAFAARFLADNDVPLALPTTTTWQPRTDLHTHFAAALPGAALVDVAARAHLTVPAAVLADVGVDGGGDVDASALGDVARARWARALDVPWDRQITFRDMETLYARRSLVTKNTALFPALLRATARALADDGIVYAELSLSTCLQPAVLQVLHDEVDGLDELERQTGTRLRFLLALSRHDDPEWDLDLLDRLEQCAGSDAVVGVDFMGHETCSTRAFVPVLERAAALAARRPGFVVRVHAGENPAFPENVRVAVDTLLPAVVEHGLQARIGHGLYGVDDETLALLAAHDGFVVEFNLSSNLALNNIQTTSQVPLARYVDAGVRVMLGTDGAGLYGTCARDEVRAALAVGLDERHLAQLAAAEDAVLARRRATTTTPAPLSSWTPPEPAPPRHFTAALAARLHDARVAQRAAQDAVVAATGRALVDAPAVPELAGAAGPRPLLWLAGAWRNAIASWSSADVARATAVLDEVLAGLAHRGGVLVTGGTNLGVEGLAHALAARHNVDVIGAIVAETQVAHLDPRVQTFWRCARTLYDKAAPLVQLVREAGGLGLFAGGGLIVADEQQAAHNLGVRHVVLSGLPGPATEAARASGHARFVDDAAAVLAALDDRRPRGRLRRPGANDCADVVVVKRTAAGDDAVLLIRRHDDAGAAAGRFALPGGFVRDDEKPAAAAVRELFEETGLRIDESRLLFVDVVQGGGRDPRDTDERWVRSHVFVVRVTGDVIVAGGSDAAAAVFVAADRRPPLAFDHDLLIARARETLCRTDRASVDDGY